MRRKANEKNFMMVVKRSVTFMATAEKNGWDGNNSIKLLKGRLSEQANDTNNVIRNGMKMTRERIKTEMRVT